MRIDVRFLDADETRCEITLTPHWIARLFGARIRRGEAAKMFQKATEKPVWVWTRTEQHVDDNFHLRTGPITRAIECTPVCPLPAAKTQR